MISYICNLPKLYMSGDMHDTLLPILLHMKVIDHKQYQTEKATKKFLHDNNMFMKAKTNKIYIGALLLALVGFA